jgi:hypothetical protein
MTKSWNLFEFVKLFLIVLELDLCIFAGHSTIFRRSANCGHISCLNISHEALLKSPDLLILSIIYKNYHKKREADKAFLFLLLYSLIT